jgi:hypothetical protein
MQQVRGDSQVKQSPFVLDLLGARRSMQNDHILDRVDLADILHNFSLRVPSFIIDIHVQLVLDVGFRYFWEVSSVTILSYFLFQKES